MRVTDLEKFSLEEIWRPYQTAAGLPDERIITAPHGLDVTAEWLATGSEWSIMVLSRLAAIGVHFPAYIKHPLVDVVRAAINRAKEG